ncbi:hypothetical protein Nepgr_026248 [Nepenthes gracilis]|uniref:Uncharacterized protein n=1 Tax=Nepenthes gracilis TaxID=150966 RepID=A0AAD3Y1V2_NEPGR|nr:hypothetical protein Nepgr_026248 [Nepenthes gracilis]
MLQLGDRNLLLDIAPMDIKFRLYLKRLSCVAQQQVGVPHLFCGPLEQKMKFASLGRFDVQTPSTSGQIPSQALAALHAKLFEQSTGNLSSSLMDQPALVPSSFRDSNVFLLSKEHHLYSL